MHVVDLQWFPELACGANAPAAAWLLPTKFWWGRQPSYCASVAPFVIFSVIYMSDVERLAQDLQTGIQFGTLPRGVTAQPTDPTCIVNPLRN